MRNGEKVMKFWQTSYIHKNKSKLIIILLAILLVVGLFLGIMCGSIFIEPKEIYNIFTSDEITKTGRILYYVRFPRVIGAIVAGVVIQTILNNPLAGPNIIGVNAGAGLAVALFSLIIPQAISFLPIFAFLGAFITMLFIYFLGEKTGSSKLTLVLAGVAINSFFNACTDFIHTLSDEAVLSSYMFKIGGLTGIQIPILKVVTIVILIATIILMFFSNELEILSLGEQTAKTLGLPVRFYRMNL